METALVRSKLLTGEVISFVSELAEAGVEQQQQRKHYGVTWLARRIYKNSKTQKFLLALLNEHQF